MAEAPKRIWAMPRIGPGGAVLGWDNGRWEGEEPPARMQAVPFVPADIADGYREALKHAASEMRRFGWETADIEAREALGAVDEALAKGDEETAG